MAGKNQSFHFVNYRFYHRVTNVAVIKLLFYIYIYTYTYLYIYIYIYIHIYILYFFVTVTRLAHTGSAAKLQTTQ